MIELVVPLAITVLVVQNGQGFAVLKAAGHTPPIDAVTMACGVGAVASAVVGGVSTCLTGPTNAIIVASGETNANIPRHVHWPAGGPVRPACADLHAVASQRAQILCDGFGGPRDAARLAGGFRHRVQGPLSLGALVAFLVTVADMPLLNVGAAFWGLLAGFAISWLLERPDFAAG